MKPIKHLLVGTGMDTLCGIDTELLDKYGVPHTPACDSKERELEKRPVIEGFEYKKLGKFEFKDKFICRKCIDELNILMKQYTNLLNG